LAHCSQQAKVGNALSSGVSIYNQLVFDQHVANIVHTASTRVYLILKSFLFRDHEILVKAFVTYARPIF